MRHSPEYRAYLRSPSWQRVRKQALQGSGYRCEHCGKTRSQAGWLEVNHKHYKTRFGHERWPQDLEALCHPCHKKADRARRRRNGLDPKAHAISRTVLAIILLAIVYMAMVILWR